jgi:hypothetical protein
VTFKIALGKIVFGFGLALLISESLATLLISSKAAPGYAKRVLVVLDLHSLVQVVGSEGPVEGFSFLSVIAESP